MLSAKGNFVPNQFVLIEQGEGWNGNFIKRETFQSYDSIIAIKTTWSDRVDIELDEQTWNYSRTTSKYRNMFLGESTQDTKDKIKAGVYKLTNLN